MTIPISNIVTVNPAVIGGGGNSLVLNGLMMSKSTLLPTNAVQSFPSTETVSNFFGLASVEYALSQKYYLGFDNSTIKPGSLLFAPYVDTDREAWLQSGSFAGATLAELQTLNGVLTVTVDGVSFTSATINLSTSTSFSDAADDIAAGFSGVGKPDCTWNPINSTFSLVSTTTGVASTITYCIGTLSAGLKFTSATGAILSQGADADTPTTAMDMVVSKTQNWATFGTVWEPSTSDKVLFATWNNNQNNKYFYAAWDTDAQAIVNNSTTCFGYLIKQAEYNGVIAIYNTKELMAFVLGMIASIDFSRTNGRITSAFKSQSGFTATVTDNQISATLLANGYSFYGAYASRNDQFNFFFDGKIPGDWEWLDPYVDQIYLNNALQLALISLLTSVNSVPYNESGYNLIRAAMLDPINAGLNSGIIRTGVQLSESQKAQVNQAAGRDVSSIIEQQGYYLQILDPGAQVRAARGSPIINFWYTDGGAVQKINVASIDIM